MISAFLDATNFFRLYTISGIQKDENGATHILYGYKNKRGVVTEEHDKLATEIILDPKLRKKFDDDDYTEIVSLAQMDSILLNNGFNKSLFPTYKKKSKPQYQFFPYLVALTATIWCFAAIIGHRFMYLVIDGIGINLPGAILIFPMIYFLADLIQEVYGYSRARQTLWVCIFVHVILGVLISFVMSFNPSPIVNNVAYQTVLDTQWRMIIGNAVGMIAGFTLNGIILAKLKVKFNGKKLWLRSIGSTLFAEIVYSVVCSSIAFNDKLGFIALIKLQIGMVAIKAMWEVFATPFLYLVSWYLKKKEGIDVFDRYTNFNPFSLKLTD